MLIFFAIDQSTTNPSWNFNFHRNLYGSKTKELTRLPSSLGHVYLSTSFTDESTQSLTSSRLFIVCSFYKALSVTPLSLIFTFFAPANLIWNSKAPPRVKAFVCLVASKKVNTNDMLQLRRHYKALMSDHYVVFEVQ